MQNPLTAETGQTLPGILLAILVGLGPSIVVVVRALATWLKAKADMKKQETITFTILNNRLTNYEQKFDQYEKDREEARKVWESRLDHFEELANQNKDRAVEAEEQAEVASRKMNDLKVLFEESEARSSKKYGEYEREIGLLKKDLSAVSLSYSTAMDELDKEKKVREALTEEVKMLHDRLDTVTLERDELAQSNTALNSQQNIHREEIKNHQTEIEGLRKRIDELEKQLAMTNGGTGDAPSDTALN